MRGPALLAPFLTSTLAASALRRRTVLWRPFLRAVLVPVLSMLVGSTLVSVTLLSTAAGVRIDVAAAAWFVLAAAGAGALLGAAWLAGELLRGAPRRLLVAGLLAAAAASAITSRVPGPGTAYPVGASHGGLPALLLSGAGVLAVATSVAALDRLRGDVLREQSMRWDAVSTIATSGDLAGAAVTLRTPPSAGRRLRAIGPRPLALLYARRDAVGWLRSPERLLGAVVITPAAGAALAGSVHLTGPLAAGGVLAGSVMLWGASGWLVDGIRHGVHTLGAPGLFGQPAAVQVLLHALAPMLLLTALAAGGAVLTLGSGSTDPTDVLLPAAMVPVLIAGRVRDAAKGPMPLRLMTPMPTAQGDGAVLVMLAWQADAPLLALLSGTLLAGLGLLGPPWILGGAVLLTALMALLARNRLQALRR